MNGNGINGHGLDNEDEEETDGSEIDEQSSDDDNDNTEQLKLALHKAMMSANQHSDDVILFKTIMFKKIVINQKLFLQNSNSNFIYFYNFLDSVCHHYLLFKLFKIFKY